MSLPDEINNCPTNQWLKDGNTDTHRLVHRKGNLGDY